jgi:hypothetical protein
MAKSNFERMIELADSFFAAKSDPDQIVVSEEVMEKLKQLHPSSLTDHEDGNGPVAWILVIPTLEPLRKQFLSKTINEKELLERTPLGGSYDSLYLCSALVLPEFRGKGLAKRLTIGAVKSIQKNHPIKSLFCWPFSPEGEALANAVADATSLPLFHRGGDSHAADMT